jgi:hypothetical protein
MLSPLSEKQRILLELINQMSQRTNAIIGSSTEHAVDLPTIDFNLDLGGLSRNRQPGTTPPGESPAPTPPPTPPSTEPATINELLSSLVNEQVDVTTPFGVVSGVLLFVGDDYIVMVEDGAQVLVRIDQIELIGE